MTLVVPAPAELRPYLAEVLYCAPNGGVLVQAFQEGPTWSQIADKLAYGSTEHTAARKGLNDAVSVIIEAARGTCISTNDLHGGNIIGDVLVDYGLCEVYDY